MKKHVSIKTTLKILFIGILTTMCRTLFQLFIPIGTQTVLEPSIFVQNGTLPLAFVIYGIIAYSAIATLFLFVRNRISGHKVIKGVKYGLALGAIWSIYLLEPLPHVNRFIDKISYPLVDSAALIVMGVFLGVLLCDNTPGDKKASTSKDLWGVACIALCFSIGRLFQYLLIDIYSSFHDKTMSTLLWMIATGVVIGIVLKWFRCYIHAQSRIKATIMLGFVIFGVNMVFFNFFMPLVFNSDIPDLLIRTGVDIVAVAIGVFLCRTRQVGNANLSDIRKHLSSHLN